MTDKYDSSQSIIKSLETNPFKVTNFQANRT